MPHTSLEKAISEKEFVGLLQGQAEMLLRLVGALEGLHEGAWSRREFFQLASEADVVEDVLDDYGARHNRSFALLRELVACVRGLALAGVSTAHLQRRLGEYPTVLSNAEADGVRASIGSVHRFLHGSLCKLGQALLAEACAAGLSLPPASFPESRFAFDGPLRRLPRNLYQEEPPDDGQKTAEIASKFAQAALRLEKLGARRIDSARERESWLERNWSEEAARTHEAAVHNLQSAYDTWVKDSGVESGDPRLPRLRGHASAALHMLETCTHLTHFVERHESGKGDDRLSARIEALVPRAEARAVTLSHLLVHAVLLMRRGRSLAEDLLPSYTKVTAIDLTLREDLMIHARPAALIVGIVNHYGVPVEMEVGGRTCNAASILEIMVTAGSNPDARRFTFRGDEKPLRDIERLFGAGLGEAGLDSLPAELAYLRSGS